MNEGAVQSSPRWRAFADAVALALGVNVWISIVVLPGLFVGTWRGTAELAAGAVPLVILVAGLWRRSETALLLIFPSALMIPVAIAPQTVSSHVYGPTRFVIVALGLVAYLFGVSFFSSFREPPPPAGMRRLSSSQNPMPPRWQRRLRIYRALAILSVLFPATMLHMVNFEGTNGAFLRQMFPGRVAQMTTVLNLVVIAAWVLIYSYAFLGVLRSHRTGDRELVADLGRLRAQVKRGKPRPAFYVSLTLAVGFFLLLGYIL
jgi:hypothetical protein